VVVVRVLSWAYWALTFINRKGSKYIMSVVLDTGIKAGDIFYSSWGYDQTNVDYYQVIGVTPSGKSVRIRRIGQEIIEHGRGVDRVAPVVDYFVGSLETVRILDSSWSGWSIKVGYNNYAYVYEGGGNEQTSWGYGH
jgi:hypothetical protein